MIIDQENGTARPSYVASHINTDEQLSREDEEDIMWSAASLYTGGVDTVQNSVSGYNALSSSHPFYIRQHPR